MSEWMTDGVWFFLGCLVVSIAYLIRGGLHVHIGTANFPDGDDDDEDEEAEPAPVGYQTEEDER